MQNSQSVFEKRLAKLEKILEKSKKEVARTTELAKDAALKAQAEVQVPKATQAAE